MPVVSVTHKEGKGVGTTIKPAIHITSYRTLEGLSMVAKLM